MQERELQVIKSLLYSSTPQSVESLMEEWDVSERTIKYDISRIREELKAFNIKLLNKKGIGYYFSPSDKPKLIDEFSLPEMESDTDINQTNIVLYTLFIKNTAPIIDISERLYFDTSSVKRFISEMPFTEKMVNLTLRDNTIVTLTGSEIEVRKYLVALITEELKTVNGIDLSLRLKKAFPLYETYIDDNWINEAEDQVKLIINQHNIWISETALEYLIVYLYVMYLRNKEKSHIIETFADTTSFKGEHRFAEQLLKRLNWGKANKDEIMLLVQIMIENNIFSEDQLNNKAEKKLSHVIELMINTLREQFPTERYNEQDLKDDLKPHLKQIIRKTELGGSFKQNPLFHQVKLKYKKHYRMAQVVYHQFCEYFDIEYTDNESSLIAIYLYKNSMSDEQMVYNAFLVCGTGRGFSKLLETRLHNLFPNINILERLSSFHLLKKQDISKADLIISTIALPEKEVPVVKISSFLGRRDIQLINQVLEYGTASSDISFYREDVQGLPLNSFDHFITGASTNYLVKEHASIFSNIILDLYSTMVNLPDSYDINQEKLLGISIHLIIALPRYFDAEGLEEDLEIVEEVMLIEKNHQILAREMDAFLNRVENTIGKGIPYMERYALYQYILN